MVFEQISFVALAGQSHKNILLEHYKKT